MYKTRSKNIQRGVDRRTKVYIKPCKSTSRKRVGKSAGKMNKKTTARKEQIKRVPSAYIYKVVDNGSEKADVVFIETGKTVLTTTIEKEGSWRELVDLVHLFNLGDLKRLTQIEGRMREFGEWSNILYENKTIEENC